VSSFVLDTDVLVAAMRSKSGASRQLLLAALEERYTMLLSVPLILEYEAVLTRPVHLEAAGVSAEDIGAVLDDLASISTRVKLAFRWRPQLRDPDDDMVLEAAVNGSADAIITFNKRDFVTGARQFAVRIISPIEALQEIRASMETAGDSL